MAVCLNRNKQVIERVCFAPNGIKYHSMMLKKFKMSAHNDDDDDGNGETEWMPEVKTNSE